MSNNISVRKKILNSLKNGFDEIITANGYQNNFKSDNVYLGYRDISSVKNFPTICIFLGDEKNTNGFDESGLMPTMETQAIIIIYTNDTDTSKNEKIFMDMLSYFGQNQNESVLLQNDLNSIKFLKSFVINEISPYSDIEKNSSRLGIGLKIRYIDAIDNEDIQYLITEAGQYFITEGNQNIILE